MAERKPQDRILHLTRVRSMPNDGSRTLNFILGYGPGDFDRLVFLRPEVVPEFEGEKAWARVHWWSKTRHKVVELVADKLGTPLSPAD